MEGRTKGPVAIPASVADHRQPRIRHHLARGEEFGVDGEAVGAAIALVKHMNVSGGPRMAELVDKVLKEREQEDGQ